MTAALTYTELLRQVPNYCERQDAAFLAELPSFINLAENRMAADLKQQGFQAVVKGPLPLADQLEKPAFWRQTISFSAKSTTGLRTPLYLRSYEFLRACYPSAEAGTPRYYADYNATHFALGPTPAANYEFELLYYARLTPLSDDNTVNWLTLNAPQALLAACVMEASLWTKNDGRIALWKAEYESSKQALLSENQERLGDRAVKVNRG
jgi:hypothetical protein